MAKLVLKLKTFIPHAKVLFSESNNRYIYFRGDIRNASWTGTYRTLHQFTIDTSTSNYTVTPVKDTGTTYRNTYDILGKLVSTSSGKASTTDIKYTKRVEKNILYLDCVISSSNPLVPGSPAIDYVVTLKITRPGSVRITGKHDGFPAYEFWRKFDGKAAELVYNYDPRTTGGTLANLLPPMDKSVDKGLSA